MENLLQLMNWQSLTMNGKSIIEEISDITEFNDMSEFKIGRAHV